MYFKDERNQSVGILPSSLNLNRPNSTRAMSAEQRQLLRELSIQLLWMKERNAVPYQRGDLELILECRNSINELFLSVDSIIGEDVRHSYVPSLEEIVGGMARDIHVKLCLINEKNLKDRLFLQKVNDIIFEHYSDSTFTIPDLMNLLHSSQRPVQKKFKRLLNITPVAYLRMFRLEVSRLMIQNGHQPLNGICFSVGFTSLTYFSSCFKHYFGYSITSI